TVGGQVERVTVGCGLRHRSGADHAGGTRLVLDDDGLSQHFFHSHRSRTPGDVCRTAGRERHHQRDRALRLSMRHLAASQQQGRAHGRCGFQDFGKFEHGVSPFVVVKLVEMATHSSADRGLENFQPNGARSSGPAMRPSTAEAARTLGLLKKTSPSPILPGMFRLVAEMAVWPFRGPPGPAFTHAPQPGWVMTSTPARTRISCRPSLCAARITACEPYWM